ncbi:unnamed protein product [Toxocara canis]|uniref:Sushi domain-containing protein n=1 Tax=Toxocara canis TaxID=6265 RepID=A0A183VE13_TOXCA|nr:unnamed protein product [Toxocara canis]
MSHIAGNPCKDTIEQARKSCFDVNAISASEGTFLYRVENAEAASCGLEGSFDVSFMKADSSLVCEKPGSSVHMNLSCIGSWKGNAKESYIAVQDQDSKQIKCGVSCAVLMQSAPAETTVYLSKDASCNAVSSNRASAAEIYTFRQRKTRENWAACSFPEWLQGEYESVSITDRTFSYSARTSESVPTISYCVAIDGQRVAVFSESKCGEFVGFHCLWFRSRSDSLVEFKTTDRRDDDDGKLCSDESAFDFSPWTAIVAKQPDPVACGFEGTYVTPKHRRDTDCYSLIVECSKKHLMKITAFNCETKAIFESKPFLFNVHIENLLIF